jgi:hypothetical protein
MGRDLLGRWNPPRKEVLRKVLEYEIILKAKVKSHECGELRKLDRPGKSSRTEGRVGRDVFRYASLSGNERSDILWYKIQGKVDERRTSGLKWIEVDGGESYMGSSPKTAQGRIPLHADLDAVEEVGKHLHEET